MPIVSWRAKENIYSGVITAPTPVTNGSAFVEQTVAIIR
jgi:hypothetical protein